MCYEGVVKNMGTITSTKMQHKFFELKNSRTLVKGWFDQSERGDGSLDPGQDDFARADGDVPVSGDGSHTACLQAQPVWVVYFIEYAKQHGVEAQAYQKLKEGYRLNGNIAPSVYGG